ncbi:hypothetical protein ACE6H2_023545 [Prunus campanulata]
MTNPAFLLFVGVFGVLTYAGFHSFSMTRERDIMDLNRIIIGLETERKREERLRSESLR